MSQDYINLITNVGFPIAVATYLLLRIEHKMDTLTGVICELKNVLTVINSRLD